MNSKPNTRESVAAESQSIATRDLEIPGVIDYENIHSDLHLEEKLISFNYENVATAYLLVIRKSNGHNCDHCCRDLTLLDVQSGDAEQINLERAWTEILQGIVDFGNSTYLKNFHYRLLLDEDQTQDVNERKAKKSCT